MRSEVLPILSAILFAMAGLGGCLSAGDDAVPDAPGVDAPAVSAAHQAVRELLSGVPCTVDSVPDTATSDNFETIVSDAVDDLGPIATRAELDMHADQALIAYYNRQGFTLLNVSDPRDPVEVSVWLAADSGTTYDVKFDTTGRYALVGFSDRVSLVDLVNPDEPAELDTLAHPEDYGGQAHMVFPAEIEGVQYVFVTPSISGTGVLVHKIVGDGADARFEHVTTYRSTAPHALYPQAFAPHDSYLTYEDDVDAHVLWLANGFYGIVALDVDDPANPRTLMSIPPEASPDVPAPAPTHSHTVQTTWQAGKRLLASASEVGYNSLKIYDVTNLDDPRLLGTWIYDERQPTYLQHNVQIVNGTLFLAHYEHGLFSFDLASYAVDPTVHIQPAGHWQVDGGGLIWDVNVRDGVLFLSDISQGLHVVGYGCLTPGVAAHTSDG